MIPHKSDVLSPEHSTQRLKAIIETCTFCFPLKGDLCNYLSTCAVYNQIYNSQQEVFRLKSKFAFLETLINFNTSQVATTFSNLSQTISKFVKYNYKARCMNKAIEIMDDLFYY